MPDPVSYPSFIVSLVIPLYQPSGRSLYSLSSLELPVIILLTAFTGFISTGRADIKDMYLWNNGSSSKYADVEEYIEYHFLDDKLLVHQ